MCFYYAKYGYESEIYFYYLKNRVERLRESCAWQLSSELYMRKLQRQFPK